MARDLNRWEGIGRLGKDPELRYMPDGTASVTITLACGDDYKDKNTGQVVERTEWVRCAAYGKLAEIIGQYGHKGKQVFASGKFTTRPWKDKDGQDRYTTEIRLQDLQLLGSKDDGQSQGRGRSRDDNGFSDQPREQAPPPSRRPPPSFDDFGDDIPF